MNWGFNLGLKMFKNLQESKLEILAENFLYSAKFVKSKGLAMKLNRNILTLIYS